MAAMTRQLAVDAVRVLLTTHGIEAVTMRKVAIQAGISVGAVQHVFKTKEALIVAAMDNVSANFTAELNTLIRESDSPENALRSLCLLLAGALDGQRDAGIIWLAFVSKASTNKEIAVVHQKSWLAMEQVLQELLRRVSPGVDRDDAATILALLDGLAIARVTEPERMPVERAKRIALKLMDSLTASVGTNSRSS